MKYLALLTATLIGLSAAIPTSDEVRQLPHYRSLLISSCLCCTEVYIFTK